MNETTMFVALIEVEPIGAGILDPMEDAGAYVRCYIPALNETSARKKLAKTLGEDRLKLTEEKWLVDNAKTNWERPGNEDAESHIDLALKTEKVVYGEFHVWGHDAPDA